MVKIFFVYIGVKYTIQSTKDEKMKVIFQKFASESKTDKKSVFFLYSGNQIINEELTFEEIANKEDKNRKEMNILVNKVSEEDIKKEDNENNQINEINEECVESKGFICPECHEFSKIHIEDYKISIKCKNKHFFKDLTFMEYFGKISSNKSNNNPRDNGFVCKDHNDNYDSYCKNCKINLCRKCQNSHNSHEIIRYENLLPDINMLKSNNENFKQTIDKLKNDIEEIKKEFNKVIENIEQYYKIINDVIKNYNKNKLNYEILHNIKEIYNYNIQEDLNKIIKDNKIRNKVENLLDIYEQINKKS